MTELVYRQVGTDCCRAAAATFFHGAQQALDCSLRPVLGQCRARPGASGKRPTLLRSTFLLSQGYQGASLFVTMDVNQSTRVSAPDISHRPRSSPTLRDGVSVTAVTQSLSGDGATSMSALKKIGQSVDLRRKIKFTTWNVMTLSGTGYQVVHVHELARFNLSVAGITEARYPAGKYSVEDALLLHSGGDHHVNGGPARRVVNHGSLLTPLPS